MLAVYVVLRTFELASWAFVELALQLGSEGLVLVELVLVVRVKARRTSGESSLSTERVRIAAFARRGDGKGMSITLGVLVLVVRACVGGIGLWLTGSRGNRGPGIARS